jgi:hypothetical protein
MKPTSALCAVLVVALSCKSAAIGHVTVAVVDSRCGYPLPGARVVATSNAGEHHDAVADAQGVTTFSLAASNWQFIPTLSGTFSGETASVR